MDPQSTPFIPTFWLFMSQELYSQYFIFFVTYEQTQQAFLD
jgi:hypothetical protein